MNERKFRHEYKYFITYSDYLALSSRLSAVAMHDTHTGGSGEYNIRSLYFDNLYDSALKDKINGVNNHEKFRIRCYNYDDSFVRLEKKSKINGLCNKISAPLTRGETERIINGDIAWMPESGRALVVELYSKMKAGLLKPKVIVEYTREPYVFRAGNVRITFDYNLRTGLKCTDLFDFAAPLVSTNAGEILVEIKYDEFLPDIIRDIAQINNRQCGAFSKYGACRMYG